MLRTMYRQKRTAKLSIFSVFLRNLHIVRIFMLRCIWIGYRYLTKCHAYISNCQIELSRLESIIFYSLNDQLETCSLLLL